MATDIHAILKNLLAFYDFGGKDVLHVGAGGGQLIGYAHLPRSIRAIDCDPGAAEKLKEKVRASGLESKFSIEVGDFCATRLQADVVFLEFCLHEMEDPGLALSHAASLAPHILIVDHAPDSEWSYFCCEMEKIEASWRAIEQAPPRRTKTFQGWQRFATYEELAGRLSGLGDEARRRIGRLASSRDIEISMPYGMALI